MLLLLGQMAASSFFLIAPEAQSGDSPWSSHAWIAIDDSKNDFDPCILFSSVLGLPLIFLQRLFKGQCVIEMVPGFLKHLQANYQLLNDAIRDSWL